MGHVLEMKSKAVKQKKGNGFPNGRQNAINERLRRDVLEGVRLPGSRLPTRIELQKKYRTTPVTVQRALDKMEADGFIRSEGRRGTFISSNPPCLSRYAIVFPFHIFSEKQAGTFWQVLGRLATSRKMEDGKEFSLYMGLNGHIDEPDYKRLYQDLQSYRLAGIIFASGLHLFSNTPLYKEIFAQKGLPKVAFMSEAAYPTIPALTIDPDDFLRKALDLFQSRGCRRLAIVGTMSGEGDTETFHREPELPAEAERRGMELRPEWVQVMHYRLASRTRQLMRLMFQGPRNSRPDALLIWDSSLVPAATQGISELGLTSKDITVVGHCNFPEAPKSMVPITFVGFNVNVFLDTCMNIMRRRKEGLSNLNLTMIPLELKEGA